MTGAKHAVAVVNGTAAFTPCIALSRRAPRDEVIVPTLTFVATANAVAYCGQCRTLPTQVPRRLRLMQISPISTLTTFWSRGGRKINRLTGRPVAAVVVMATLTSCRNRKASSRFARAHNMPLVEDAAEAPGLTPARSSLRNLRNCRHSVLQRQQGGDYRWRRCGADQRSGDRQAC